jgi:hypothetical protein
MERDHAPTCVAHVISTAVCKLQAEKLRDLCMILPKKSGAQEKIFIMWLLTSLVGRVGADAYAALRAKKVSNNFLHGAIKRESVAIFHYFSIPPKPRQPTLTLADVWAQANYRTHTNSFIRLFTVRPPGVCTPHAKRGQRRPGDVAPRGAHLAVNSWLRIAPRALTGTAGRRAPASPGNNGREQIFSPPL